MQPPPSRPASAAPAPLCSRPRYPGALARPTRRLVAAGWEVLGAWTAALEERRRCGVSPHAGASHHDGAFAAAPVWQHVQSMRRRATSLAVALSARLTCRDRGGPAGPRRAPRSGARAHLDYLVEEGTPLDAPAALAAARAGRFRPVGEPARGLGVGARVVWLHAALQGGSPGSWQVTWDQPLVDRLDAWVVGGGAPVHLRGSRPVVVEAHLWSASRGWRLLHALGLGLPGRPGDGRAPAGRHPQPDHGAGAAPLERSPGGGAGRLPGLRAGHHPAWGPAGSGRARPSGRWPRPVLRGGDRAADRRLRAGLLRTPRCTTPRLDRAARLVTWDRRGLAAAPLLPPPAPGAWRSTAAWRRRWLPSNDGGAGRGRPPGAAPPPPAGSWRPAWWWRPSAWCASPPSPAAHRGSPRSAASARRCSRPACCSSWASSCASRRSRRGEPPPACRRRCWTRPPACARRWPGCSWR
ncbi:MAG: hypothetical protein IPO09_15440 [Anaeromyxobacter sp.]|nr:hypothetical protein [Anaeromyxobacter sp.]